MTGRDDPLADACTALAGYVSRLEGLVGEPSAPGPAPDLRVRHAEIPEPYGPPGRALMDAWEGIPRLEAWCKYVGPAGHPGYRTGRSAGNFAAALEAIPKLAAGLDQYAQGKAYRFVDRLTHQARSVPGIDENPRLRHLPKRDGEGLPPRCPFCERRYLVANMDASPVVVYCQYPACPGDRFGNPAVAVMGTSPDGRGQMAWSGGLTEIAPDLAEGAGDG